MADNAFKIRIRVAITREAGPPIAENIVLDGNLLSDPKAIKTEAAQLIDKMIKEFKAI